MPVPGYSAWSVTAGEQPTTSYWNILGSNDAAFNTMLSGPNTINGNVLEYGTVTGLDLGIAAGTNAIYQTSASDYVVTNSWADVSYLNQPTVNFAAGGDALVIGTAYIQQGSAVGVDLDLRVVCDGSAPTYPVSGYVRETFANATSNNGVSMSIVQYHSDLAAGNHTFKLQATKDTSAVANVRTGNVYILVIPITN